MAATAPLTLTKRADPPGRIRRRWRVSPRGVALIIWVLAVGAAAAGVGFVLALRRSGAPIPEVYLSNIWSALVLPAAGLLLISRVAYRMVGWLLVVGGLGAGLAALCFGFAAWGVHRPHLHGLAGAAVWLGGWIWLAGMLAPVIVLLLPDGAATGWRRRAVVVAWGVMGVRALLSALTGSTGTDPISGATVALPNPLAVRSLEPLVWPIFLVAVVVLLAVQVAGAAYLTRRWRHATGRDRGCLVWLAAAAWTVLLPWGAVPVVGTWLDALIMPAFAATVAVALLRYRDGDADAVLGRGFMWASMTTCVVAGYLLVVSVLAAVLQRAAGASLALAASGLVALLVAPVRTRLQRSVDRLLYGARADPYASVAALARRLESSVSPEDVLPTVARTITDELRLPYAAFHLTGPGGDVAVTEHGVARGALITLPVDYLGVRVGNLVVSTSGHGVALRAAERRLLADLARQSGAAAHGVATLAELRRSRERLVAAREEERRSLRRELHDDLGAMLTGVALGVDATGNQLPPGSPAAEQLSRVRVVVSAAVTDLRRIIDGLRPPALDEVGLVEAIRDRLLSLSEATGPGVCVNAQRLPMLPPEVEVACYHVTVEAVHNAVRHADARHVTVRMAAAEGLLQLAVTDDGHWTEATADGGQGMTTMRQRVEEIGGQFHVGTGSSGTTVSAALPIGGRR
jgi:two-component system, NarL family, sensor kinase